MSVPGPVLGPCESWITGADVAACCGVDYGSGNEAMDTAAVEASMALFEISGRMFTGGCLRTVRPCRSACGCWGSRSSGPWHWTSAGAGWGWADECGDRCGCGHLSTVKLAGYPVTEIVSVTIDGVEVDPATYRLDGWTDLVRLEGKWPACQDLAAGDDEDGSFVVRYRWGVAPPPLGEAAAAALACQIYKACNTGEACELPANATKVTRQGITVERGVLLSWFDPKKPTGLVPIDLFIRAHWAKRKGRRAAVWSPDVQGYARRVGT